MASQCIFRTSLSRYCFTLWRTGIGLSPGRSCWISFGMGAIRKALGENSEKPRFIETRWAEGYRYIGPFVDLSVAGSAAASAVATSSPTLTIRRASNAADQSLPETHAELSYNNTQASEGPQEVVAIPTLTVVPDQPGSDQVAVPAHARSMVISRWQFRAVLAGAVLVVLGLAAWTFFWRTKPEQEIIGPDWSKAKSTQLTNQVGAEFSVNLAPDGKSFIYASRASGNWDLYWQRVGGRFIVNLTKDSPADDIQPAYSPDGNYIAFH